MKKINVVVSRYNKSTEFIKKIENIKIDNIHINCYVYDKLNSQNPFNIPVNKGNEASVYLKYIIDFYDDLPDFTFFIHDEEFSWHHSGSIIDKLKESIESKKQFYNVNDKCIWNKKHLINKNYYKELLKWYERFIDKYIPLSKVPNNDDFIYSYRGSAQFLVHKNLITNFPITFYKDIYEWIIVTELPNYLSGRFLEWTWHIFWDIYPNFIRN